jgi:hypothetical protein
MRILCKCVINNAYGGYALSDAAILWMAANGGLPLMIDEGYEPDDIESGRYLFHAAAFRSLPLLVECVEALGEAASGSHGASNWTDASLSVHTWDAEFGVEYRIEESHGRETVTHPWQPAKWQTSPIWEVK